MDIAKVTAALTLAKTELGNAITAELSQGVLRVRLPKQAERKPRVIPVRPAA